MKDISLPNVERLGVAIRLKRKEKGLSQNKLAELLGVERKWVLHLEAGNSKAEIGLVLKVLSVLGIHVLLSEDDRAPRRHREVPTSRLDEVFRRLQRPVRK